MVGFNFLERQFELRLSAVNLFYSRLKIIYQTPPVSLSIFPMGQGHSRSNTFLNIHGFLIIL